MDTSKSLSLSAVETILSEQLDEAKNEIIRLKSLIPETTPFQNIDRIGKENEGKQAGVEDAAKEYVKQLTISSASVDPRRDRERYLGFIAGAKWASGERGEVERLKEVLLECKKYFGENDKTLTQHRMYDVINEVLQNK